MTKQLSGFTNEYLKKLIDYLTVALDGCDDYS